MAIVLLVGLQALTLLLLVAYLGWGIYTLDLRYRRHEESSPLIEALTLLAVLLFYAIEVSLLRQTMRDESVIYMFAVLGLFVSGAALYGHMAVSLTSRLLVDVVTPDSHQDPSQPRLGPAEALERQHDYEGAIQEYLVLARIFPRDPLVARRLGENYVANKQFQDAIPWFQRAFERSGDDEDGLIVVHRWIETAQKHLADVAEAERACLAFLRRYPKSSNVATIRERLEGVLQGNSSATRREQLELLEAVVEKAPSHGYDPAPEALRHNAPLMGLDRLAETGITTSPAQETEAPPSAPNSAPLGLEALSAIEADTDTEVQAKATPSPPSSKKPRKTLGLDALNDKPIEEA